MAETKLNDETELYKTILNANGILNPVSEVIIAPPQVKSKAFLSDRLWITVKFKNANLHPMHLFTKRLVSGNQSHVELSRAVKAFEKESTFLNKYVPLATQLLQRKGIDDNLVNIYPKCYYGDDNNMIVMENLVVNDGYCVMGGEERVGFDEATFALSTLAKHHAISYAMIREEGGMDKFSKKFPYLADFEGFDVKAWVDTIDPWFNSCFKTNLKILEMHMDVDGVSEAMVKLKKFMRATPSLNGSMVASFKTKDNDLCLLNHGDTWYGNHMYLKDNDTGKIIHHKIVDFQFLRYTSPAVDVAHYLFTSVQTDIRQNLFPELVEVYLTTLNNLSKDLGHPTNLDYETFISHYRKKAYFGFIASFLVCCGPGMAIFDGYDLTKVGIHDWGPTTDRLADEWISKNQDEARNCVKEIILVVNEFFELVDGDISCKM